MQHIRFSGNTEFCLVHKKYPVHDKTIYYYQKKFQFPPEGYYGAQKGKYAYLYNGYLNNYFPNIRKIHISGKGIYNLLDCFKIFGVNLLEGHADNIKVIAFLFPGPGNFSDQRHRMLQGRHINFYFQ